MKDSMLVDIRFVFIVMGYIITAVATFFAAGYQLKKVKTDTKDIKKVVFDKNGLNLVSNKSCHERRNGIIEIVNREAGITADAIDKIDNLSENIHLLMGAQGLTPKKFIKKDPKKTFYQCSE